MQRSIYLSWMTNKTTLTLDLHHKGAALRAGTHEAMNCLRVEGISNVHAIPTPLYHFYIPVQAQE
jgi:hypothetical protein